MKDRSHHRRYVQKKIIQLSRKENNQINNNINGFDLMVKESPSTSSKEAQKY